MARRGHDRGYGARVQGPHISRRGDSAVVSVLGDLDIATSPSLRQSVLTVLQGGVRSVVIDLTPTDFIDSVGLGVIVAIWKRVRVHGGELAVVCPEPRLQRVFRVVDLHQVLPLHDTVEAALAALASGPTPMGDAAPASVPPHE